MAIETPVAICNPQEVGDAFLKRYYDVLHRFPELVCKFYEELSVLSRPRPDGAILTVSTVNGIMENILSLNSKDYSTEIETANSQRLSMNGVIVRITGCLTGKDKVGRKFIQAFFLVPRGQDDHYARCDVFRYRDEGRVLRADRLLVNRKRESITAAPDTAAPTTGKVCHAPVNVSTTGAKLKPATVGQKAPALVTSAPEKSCASIGPVDAPKKSYASLVSSWNPVTDFKYGMQFEPAKGTCVGPKAPAAAPAYAAAAPNRNPTFAKSNVGKEALPTSSHLVDEDEDRTIYIYNLPKTATVEQVEKVFKKYGKIKPGGVEVSINEVSCFGYVEFEQVSSTREALKEGAITFDTGIILKAGVTEECTIFIKKLKKVTRDYRETWRGILPDYMDNSLFRGGPTNDFRNRGQRLIPR